MKKNALDVIYAIIIIMQTLSFAHAFWKLLFRYSLLTLMCTILMGIGLVTIIIIVVKDKINRSK